MPPTIPRGIYHTGSLAAAVEHGTVLGAANEGRFATATRADYAAAAALTGKDHEKKVYELGGDEPYTLAELAAEVARQTGKPVVYRICRKRSMPRP